MRVTFAHEYNHILQFAYDTFQEIWMFESSATWVEEQGLSLRSTTTSTSYRPLREVPVSERWSTGDNRDPKIYGSATWNHFLTGKYWAATYCATPGRARRM